MSHVGPRLYTTSLENTNKRGESETQGSPFLVFVDRTFHFVERGGGGVTWWLNGKTRYVLCNTTLSGPTNANAM